MALTYAGSTNDNFVVIDQIGVHSSSDPGSGWSVAGVEAATKDHTLVRKPTVSSGTIIGLSPRVPMKMIRNGLF